MQSPRNARSGSARTSVRTLLAALLASVLLPGPLLAEEEPPLGDEPEVATEHPAITVANKAFDAVVLRPVGFAATVIGAGLFVPAALLASPGGRDPIEEALERFVLTPWDYVAERPLGEF